MDEIANKEWGNAFDWSKFEKNIWSRPINMPLCCIDEPESGKYNPDIWDHHSDNIGIQNKMEHSKQNILYGTESNSHKKPIGLDRSHNTSPRSHTTNAFPFRNPEPSGAFPRQMFEFLVEQIFHLRDLSPMSVTYFSTATKIRAVMDEVWEQHGWVPLEL